MLIKLTAEHLDLILQWRNDINVRENMYSTHVIDEGEHQAWFRSVEKDSSKQYFLFQYNEKPYGVIYFYGLAPFSWQAMWGFYGATNAPRGNGLLMELSALEYAFNSLDLQKLNCEVIASNQRVINLHLKTGFKEEGRFRNFHFDGKILHDVVRLGMIAKEFPEARDNLLARIGTRLGKAI